MEKNVIGQALKTEPTLDMKNKLSALTYKIVAFEEIQQVDTNESIDWAFEMMQLGYESPTLFMLASFNKPTNYFEVINYVKDTVRELGLEMKSGDDAILSYASYYIQKIAEGENVRDNLTKVYDVYQSGDYEDFLFDFYMLHWAWDDLDYFGNQYSYHWPAAKKNNIEKITIEEAVKWVAEYQNRYLQTISPID